MSKTTPHIPLLFKYFKNCLLFDLKQTVFQYSCLLFRTKNALFVFYASSLQLLCTMVSLLFILFNCKAVSSDLDNKKTPSKHIILNKLQTACMYFSHIDCRLQILVLGSSPRQPPVATTHPARLVTCSRQHCSTAAKYGHLINIICCCSRGYTRP